jgi:hypothetical protein
MSLYLVSGMKREMRKNKLNEIKGEMFLAWRLLKRKERGKKHDKWRFYVGRIHIYTLTEP